MNSTPVFRRVRLRAARPVKIVGREREHHCTHGPGCQLLCFCPRCGTDRRALRDLANGHGWMSDAERRCWSGSCAEGER